MPHPPEVFVLVCNTVQKTQVFSNTITCPKPCIQWPPSFTLDVWTTATPFWLSNAFPSSMAKADAQRLSERSQNRLIWSVKFKLNHVLNISQNDFPIPQCVQIFPSFPLLTVKLSIESTDDQNIHPSMLGCWLLPRVQIMSLGARPPLYLPRHSRWGKTHQISWTGSRYVNGETLYRLYILSLTPNCHTSIVHVFLAADLKQAVSHFMSSYIAGKVTPSRAREWALV